MPAELNRFGWEYLREFGSKNVSEWSLMCIIQSSENCVGGDFQRMVDSSDSEFYSEKLSRRFRCNVSSKDAQISLSYHTFIQTVDIHHSEFKNRSEAIHGIF